MNDQEEPTTSGSPDADATAPGARKSSSSSLYSNAFFVWVNQAGTGFAGFAFWALAARIYDADDVGLGSAAFAVLTLLSMLSTLGLGLALIRFYPEAGEGRLRLANAVFTGNVIAATVLSVVFIIGLPLWAPSLDFLRDQPIYALAFILFVVGGTLSIVQTQAFMAVRRGRYILYQVVCIQLGRLALPAALAAFFGAFGVLAATGLARLIGTLYGFVLLVRGLPGYRPAWTIDPPAIGKLLPFSLGNYVANFLILAPGLLLPLMVVSVIGAEDGAYFYIAWFIGFLPITFSASLGTSLFAEGSYDPQALHDLLRRALVSGLAIASVVALALLALANVILLAFGSDYSSEGATLLRIMAVAALPATVVNVYIGALRVRRKALELVLITGAMAVTIVALSRALLPSMGLEGAGLAHAVGQTVGLTIVIARTLTAVEGPVSQRIRGFLTGLAGPT